MTDANQSIVLIGFMGTGKSESGRQLAKILGWPFLETDSIIEENLGASVSQIFSRFGETRFRDEETAVLQGLSIDRPAVIVTGGGAILRPENMACIRRLGTVICLTANLATLEQRLEDRKDRPLLPIENRSETIAKLSRARELHYEKAADLTIDTSRLDPAQVAELIIKSLALSH